MVSSSPMKLKHFEQKNLFQFTPFKGVLKIPVPLAYQDLVFGAEPQDQEALDLQKSLEEVLALSYPGLGFIDTLRLSQIILTKFPEISLEKLFILFNFKWNPELQKLIQNIILIPAEFLKWAALRDINFTEVKLINWGLANTKNFKALLEFLPRLNPSRQIAMKTLEYFIDLSDPQLLEQILKFSNAEKLSEFMYTKRFPEISKRDDEHRKKTLMFPWPSHVKAQWIRQGDRSGIEIRFIGFDAQDLNKKISALNNVKESFQDKIWN